MSVPSASRSAHCLKLVHFVPSLVMPISFSAIALPESFLAATAARAERIVAS
jgi:hypothetical protein